MERVTCDGRNPQRAHGAADNGMDLGGADLILCQITSQAVYDQFSISLSYNDFNAGSIRVESNIRPNKLFTFDRKMIRSRCGEVNPPKIREVIDRLVLLLTKEPTAQWQGSS
jgi:mRNA interferase MazF